MVGVTENWSTRVKILITRSRVIIIIILILILILVIVIVIVISITQQFLVKTRHNTVEIYIISFN